MDTLSHGSMGSHLQPFTELFSSSTSTFNAGDLADLAIQMKALPDEPKDGADPEENLWVPAGYTYFAQFIDHDLTFDSTSSLNPADRPPQGSRVPSNLRTPRFDLDSLYGDGPDANPFMYENDGASLLTDNHDLLRSTNDRAIIGDKRNDENSIICQVHLNNHNRHI